MQLEGSCHCGAVTFSLESAHPYPYQRCYCSICRKTQGGGGYAINLGGDAESLKVRGRQLISIYHARMKGAADSRAHASTAERHFCSQCGLGITIADWHMVASELASGQLTQVLNVHVEGHQSYWLVTRPEQTDSPQLQVFARWLQEEIWLAQRQLEPSLAAG